MNELSAEQRRALLKSIIGTRGRDAALPIERLPEGVPAPLSFAQERLWVLSRLAETSTVYNLPAAIRITGPLNPKVLEAALNRIVARHEALRTTYVFDDQTGKPLQQVRPAVEFTLPFADFAHLVPTERERAVRDRRRAQGLTPFDLAIGPPWRMELVRLSFDEHLLLFTVHHLAFDIISREVFFRELCAFLHRGSDSVDEPPPPPIRYIDFAWWERQALSNKAAEQQVEYWRRQLEGAPALIGLVPDRPRPKTQTFHGEQVRATVDATRTSALRTFARREGATLHQLAIGAYALALSRFSGDLDIVIGTPTSRRTRRELEGLIGLFLNTAPLRVDLSGRPTVRELIARVRETALAAYDHQDVPFERIVQVLQPVRDSGYPPIFQTWLYFQPPPVAPRRAGSLSLEILETDELSALFDFTLQVADHQTSLELSLIYNDALYDSATAQRLLRTFERLLIQFLEHPEHPAAGLSVLDPTEIAELTQTLAGPTVAMPEEGLTLPELISAQALRGPTAPAVSFLGETISYAELERRSDTLAGALIASAIRPGDIVAVSVERSIEQIIAIIAVMKAGAVYLPIDPFYPRDRIDFMVSDSGARLVVVDPRHQDLFPETLPRLSPGTPFPEPVAGLPPPAIAAPAYAIYTSGSTGRPKLALNHHRGLSNDLRAMRWLYTIGPGDVVLQQFAFSFDASLRELFWPLISGAKLLLAKPRGQQDAAYIRDTLREERVTAAQFVPSMLRAVLQEPLQAPSLRFVFCGGEALTPEIQQSFFEQSQAQLINCYGMTEVSCDVTAWDCSRVRRADRRTPIGTPYPNVRTYVLDPEQRLLPRGAVGELCVGGAGVGYGYHGRIELTAERFVPDPFVPAGRMYRTGDRVRWLADGNLEFLGRLDDQQVKIRGFRIELGEIEQALLNVPDVKDAAVIVRADAPGEPRLVAYVSGRTSPEQLRAALIEVLPEPFVPSAIVLLDRLPWTPNGKIDRAALPAPAAVSVSPPSSRTPAHEAERALAEIWTAVLGRPVSSLDSNFFELGGDSLLALDVVSKARAAGYRIEALQVFEHQTLEALARVADRIENAPAPATPAAENEARMSPVQAWFFENVDVDPGWYSLKPLVLELAEGIGATHVTTALASLVAAHEAFRLGFTHDARGWHQQRAARVDAPPLNRIRVSESEREEFVAREGERLQRDFALDQPPLLRASLVECPGTAPTLLLAAHHLIADAVSERTLLSDLDRGLRGLPVEPEPTSFSQWVQRLTEASSLALFESELPYWRNQAGSSPLPSDGDGSADTEGTSVRVRVSFEEPATRKLLGLRHRPVEVILAATALAMSRFSQSNTVSFSLSGHGREGPAATLDLSRTVGWGTASFPVCVRVPVDAQLSTVVENARTALREIPHGGVGFGVLRRYGAPHIREELITWPEPPVSFNYLGVYASALTAPHSFRLSRVDVPVIRSPGQRRFHPVVLIARIVMDKLELDLEFGKGRLSTMTAQTLAASIKEQILCILNSGDVS